MSKSENFITQRKVVNLSRYDSVPIILHPSIDNIRFSFLLWLARPPKIRSRPRVNVLFSTYVWYYRKSVSTKILRPITFDFRCFLHSRVDRYHPYSTVPQLIQIYPYLRDEIFIRNFFFFYFTHEYRGRQEGSETRSAMT